MCGRYVRKSTRREIAAWFDAEDTTAAWGESYNIAPQTFQPIVRRNRHTGEREIVMMRWGLVPYWSKDAKVGQRTINARAETLATAPAFREAFRQRRCLVPADAFYEWQTLAPGQKQPFAIALASGTPYAFAGLWERWKDPATAEFLETFSIITTAANQLLAPLHNRMPVILEPNDYQLWLDTTTTDLPQHLLRPFPAEHMTAWKVNKAVGNVRNDRPELLAQDTSAEPGSEQVPNESGNLFPDI